MLNIGLVEYTPAELIAELVSECGEREQLRLLAWANAPRRDLADGKWIKYKHSDEIGPGDRDDQEKTASAVAGAGTAGLRSERIHFEIGPVR